MLFWGSFPIQKIILFLEAALNLSIYLTFHNLIGKSGTLIFSKSQKVTKKRLTSLDWGNSCAKPVCQIVRNNHRIVMSYDWIGQILIKWWTMCFKKLVTEFESKYRLHESISLTTYIWNSSAVGQLLNYWSETGALALIAQMLPTQLQLQFIILL